MAAPTESTPATHHLPVLAAIALVILGVGLLAANWLAKSTSADTNFSIRATTQVVRLDIPCDETLTWDLPAGLIGDPSVAGGTTDSDMVVVQMHGGASAALRIDATGLLEIQWQRDAAYHCASGDGPRIEVDTGNGRLPMEGDVPAYRSRNVVNRGAPPILPLRGRVLLGGEIAEGAGFAGAVYLPILLSADVEARTSDATGQKRLIHAEDVETGSMVDTHSCLSVPQHGTALADCLRDTASEASLPSGFIHFPPTAEAGLPTLGVQVSLVGCSISIRPHGGNERRMMVTTWSKLLTSSWLQIFLALAIGLGTLFSVLGINLKEMASCLVDCVGKRKRSGNEDHGDPGA